MKRERLYTPVSLISSAKHRAALVLPQLACHANKKFCFSLHACRCAAAVCCACMMKSRTGPPRLMKCMLQQLFGCCLAFGVSRACSLTRVAGLRSHPLGNMSDEEAENEELEAVDDRPLQIYTATCISGGGLKGVWMPTIEVASGVSFIKLNKWDRHLTHYITGKPLNLHAGGKKPKNSINVEWFQTMTDLRRQACNDSLKKLIVQAAEASGGKVPEKIRPATQADEFLAGRFVTVQAPPYKDPENPDAEAVDGPQLRLLWKLKTPDVWMELTLENLEYAKKAILGSPAWEQPVSARAKHSPGRKRRRRGPKPRGQDALAEDEPPDQGGEAPLQDEE